MVVKKTSSSILDDIRDEKIISEENKSDLARTCELLLNEKWRKRKTVLRERVISSLSTLDTLAQLYDVKFLHEWITAYTEYITSKEGRGRQDIVDIAKYRIDMEERSRKELLGLIGKR